MKPNEFEKRTFFVLAREAQTFEDAVRGPWFLYTEDAKACRPANKDRLVLKITVEMEGYYHDGVWHPVTNVDAKR